MRLELLPKSLISAIAIVAILNLVSSASAAILASLRSDYDTPTSAHTNGQTVAGRIPDTFGTGNWDFFARNTIAPGGTQTAMVYSTSANSVRNANAYVFSTGGLNLPGISNSQLIFGGNEGAPASDELALHPGDAVQSQKYLVFRWTPGAGEYGMVNLSGSIRDLGIFVDGISFSIYNTSGTAIFGPTATSGNHAISFNIDTTTSPGSFIDFVVDPRVNYYSDQSAFKVTIVPEPTSLGLLGIGATGLLVRKRR